MDYPALQVNVNRERASELGLDPKEVVDNLITSLTSDAMIAPSYWVDPEERQQLFRHRAISGKPGEVAGRSEGDAAARAESEAAHLFESSGRYHSDPHSHGSGSLPTAADD